MEGGDGAPEEDGGRRRCERSTGGKMLRRKGGGEGKVVWGLGGELLAPHIDVGRATDFFTGTT